MQSINIISHQCRTPRLEGQDKSVSWRLLSHIHTYLHAEKEKCTLMIIFWLRWVHGMHAALLQFSMIRLCFICRDGHPMHRQAIHMLALGKKIVHDLNHAMKGASWVPNIISSLPPRGMNGQHQRHTFMPKLICHWRARIAPTIRPAWQKGDTAAGNMQAITAASKDIMISCWCFECTRYKDSIIISWMYSSNNTLSALYYLYFESVLTAVIVCTAVVLTHHCIYLSAYALVLWLPPMVKPVPATAINIA